MVRGEKCETMRAGLGRYFFRKIKLKTSMEIC